MTHVFDRVVDSHATTPEFHESWVNHRACSEEDASLFFDPDTEDGEERISRQEKLARRAMAKAICAQCPVADPCLEEAIRMGDRFSIAGGKTPQERGWKRARA